MNSEILFSQALGLPSPWKVEDIHFSNDSMSVEIELHIYLGFESGEQFVDEWHRSCLVSLIFQIIYIRLPCRGNDEGNLQ